MKKTLVALAVLATAGTAFAQNALSLTGNFGVGVQRNVAPGNKAHLGITDGSLTFAGSEDLGDGLTAGFSLSSDFFRWEKATTTVTDDKGNKVTAGKASVTTTDVFLTLKGGFGQVKAGEWESLSTAWTSGNVAPISLPTDPYADGYLVQADSRAKRLAYTTPDFSGFKASLTVTDRTAEGTKTSTGTEAAASLGFSYTAGALSAALAAKNLNVKDNESYQLGASYDFGAAKVGVGVDQGGLAAPAILGTGKRDRLGYLVSVAAPVGPVTLGATYAMSTIDGNEGEDDVKADMAALAAEYALSKRTAINASVAKFGGDEEFSDKYQGQYRLKLIHSF